MLANSAAPATVSQKAVPSVREVRAHFAPSVHRRSTLHGFALFLPPFAGWICSFLAIAWMPSWPLRILAALANTLCISVLFVIGHDACHGSLTPRPSLNRLIGRLCFLTSLHPYTAWEHSHNGLHHAYTNIRDLDPVYPPYSFDEFQQLPRWRRVGERLYRNRFGIGLGALYLIQIYMRYEIMPPRRRQPKRKRLIFQIDRAMVFAFFACQVSAFAFAARAMNIPVMVLLAVGILLPMALFFWMMGFVTFLHHTHPNAPWYAGIEDWSFYSGQVRSVVHVEFPWILEKILHHITQHTAHHVDPKIPLYRLPQAQSDLETAYPEIIHELWTVKGFLRTMRSCCLYDYEFHRWLDFDGVPTTESLLASHHHVRKSA